MDESTALAQSHSAEVINEAAIHAEMVEKARIAQMKAAVVDAVREIFSSNVSAGRYIDVSRIPLICQNIDGLHQVSKETLSKIKDIDEKLEKKYVTKEQFALVKNLVFGAAAIILSAVLLALVYLVVTTSTHITPL